MEMINDGYHFFRSQLDASIMKKPDKDFAVCMMNDGHVVRIKFSKMGYLINRFAEEKRQYGFKDGDRVLLLTPLIADANISLEIFAANHLTTVMVDTGIPKAELLRLIKDADVRAIFTDRERFPLVSSFTDVPIFQTYGLKNNLELLRDTDNTPVCSNTNPEAMAIIFSSGTTSNMKPIELSYEGVSLASVRNFEVLNLLGKRRDMPCLMVFPMNHISGFACGVGMTLNGLTIATVETISSSTLVEAIQKLQPVQFGMVPKVLALFIDKLEEELKKRRIYPLYHNLRRISAFFRIKLGIRGVGKVIMSPFRQAVFGKNMHTILSGGAPVIPEVTSAMLDLGLNFVVNYSSTECGVPILESDWRVNDSLDGVGKIDSDPNVLIKINRPDENGIGEVYVKTRYGMLGYFNNPEMTKAAYDDGWFKTGDNGYIDKNKNLHICGRSKDSIMLSNGKKVSPDDLENLLLPIIGLNTSFSIVGVPSPSTGCDYIHMFIAGQFTAQEQAELKGKISRWQHKEARMYPIEDIHFIDELPKTPIGKVQRGKLKASLLERRKITDRVISTDEIIEGELPVDQEEDVLSHVNEIVMRHAGLSKPLNGTEDLINDLGIDSLTMMEICTDIESFCGIFIGSYIDVLKNTTDIARFIKKPNFTAGNAKVKQPRPKLRFFQQSKAKFNAYDFPLPRTFFHRILFRALGEWFKKNIDFEVTGLDNIEKGEDYIFCPNHQTHADGLWVWHALGDKCPPLDNIACMAKMEHLSTPVTRVMLKVLGGIPVDRGGNTMDSFKRSIEFIREGNSYLIHPEGTRTRDTKLGPFKSGAAAMAIESCTKLVPVAIDGGLDVWSYDMLLPKTKDKKTGRKKHVRITFGKPISPEAGTAEELTKMLRREVSKGISNECQ